MEICQTIFGSIFLENLLRLVTDGWVGHKISGCRCYFRAFQREPYNLVTKNFEIDSVVKKLQPFEVDDFSAIFFLKLINWFVLDYLYEMDFTILS